MFLFTPSLFPPFLVRACFSWHYPNSPKNRKTALRPCPVWLQRGSEQEKDPLLIWFYPQ
ncbi:serine/threonine protein kinase [Salmonella enterica subsp. enterica]|nr:serine/threonine protein kinase [Salmonella enterica subsp. enterica serovar Bispebjerg]ECM3600931.1 serine/threonine protein kinase [Salmonella enterica subsp. enterica serovar Senftenberg]EDV5640391.1 serine/threonine protein kinase [Salmonella enterica subsp. enterica serovar Salford]EDW1096602.1 serine/threonine protein kinase [Salmonella enterica subsp. enterica serovar Miami]MIH37358.1 serine/threonine protein kinase [Salmonella enterica subsp. enterica]